MEGEISSRHTEHNVFYQNYECQSLFIYTCILLKGKFRQVKIVLPLLVVY